MSKSQEKKPGPSEGGGREVRDGNICRRRHKTLTLPLTVLCHAGQLRTISILLLSGKAK